MNTFEIRLINLVISLNDAAVEDLQIENIDLYFRFLDVVLLEEDDKYFLKNLTFDYLGLKGAVEVHADGIAWRDQLKAVGLLVFLGFFAFFGEVFR